MALPLGVTMPAAAQVPPATPDEPVYAGPSDTLSSEVALGQLQRLTLENGLRVVLDENHSAPSVSVCVTYDVGGRNERVGRTGFAHLFEHLMFQGSRNVAKGEHFSLIASRGGRMNGTTNKDRTNYFEDLPSHELALGLWLEADRMRSLALNRANFDNQRKVVLEEFRRNYSNKVYSLGRLRLHQLVYQNYWPYEHPVIGFMEDLDNAEYEWAMEFHRDYYVPNNAVLSIAGDFEPEQALELVNKYFGDIRPNDGVPPFVEPSYPAYQSSERLSVMVDESAKTPGVYQGWRIPPARDPEHRALELAAEVLAGGDSSRLHRSLVLDKASARRVAAWTRERRGPSIFTIFYEVAPKSSVDAAQTWLDQEVTRLRVSGPSEDDLKKAKARLRRRTLSGLETNRSRAIALGEYELYWGDASLLRDELTAYDGISRSDVRAAAAKYLLDTKRSFVEIYPPGWVRDIGPPVITRSHVVKKGETLSGIALHYGMSTEQLAKQNGIGSKTHVRTGQKLLVTVKAGSRGAKQKTYIVKKGDTLSGIASKYGVTARDIARASGTTTKKALQPGQELVIPPRKKDSDKSRDEGSEKSEPKGRTHEVKKGDTLSGIALKYGVTTKELAAANGLNVKKNLLAGTTLSIPPRSKKDSKDKSGSSASKPPSSTKPKERVYVVKKGDTLSGIAARHKVSTAALARRNGISTKKAIRPGQKLTIPDAD